MVTNKLVGKVKNVPFTVLSSQLFLGLTKIDNTQPPSGLVQSELLSNTF